MAISSLGEKLEPNTRVLPCVPPVSQKRFRAHLPSGEAHWCFLHSFSSGVQHGSMALVIARQFVSVVRCAISLTYVVLLRLTVWVCAAYTPPSVVKDIMFRTDVDDVAEVFLVMNELMLMTFDL